VINRAVGIITDWQGRALKHGSDGRVIAAGDPRVHAQAIELLTLSDH
jgi:inositol-phosphate phosphatase / L-galactose 1-phosphate phosphatase / histidinol-phosphatase